jgi:5,6-dimethylbenzimidazole synthase
MTKHEFPQPWKEGVYQAIARRRDIRHFLPDPIPMQVLTRILSAAHHAASVGFMQPWNFIVVENRTIREKINAHVEEERVLAAENFEAERKAKYLAFKLHGVLDAPINLCVTCDPTRFGPVVLGRNTIRETDIYSTCCAIQNLWLAARAEGIGAGWVSILRPEKLREYLSIPEHVIPIGYLCLGYVAEFPEKPMLETAGWLPRMPLEEVVFRDRWGIAPDAEFSKALRDNSGIESIPAGDGNRCE